MLWVRTGWLGHVQIGHGDVEDIAGFVAPVSVQRFINDDLISLLTHDIDKYPLHP